VSGRPFVTRRRFVAGGGAVAAAVAAGVVIDQSASGPAGPLADLPAPVADLPVSQHAWDATLARDSHGNVIAPRHARLLLFDVSGTPDPRYARQLESALRRIEHRHAWGPEGVLFTVGWSPAYFEDLLHVSTPLPRAKPLSDFELPAIDTHHLCVHLASDMEANLVSCARALRSALAPILTLRETRTGFAGAGLPAANQQGIGGLPTGDPVAESAPLYMGFKSGFKKNQATEAAVTLTSGDFIHGTTMTVSYMRLSLESWYGNLSAEQRIQRMYSPQSTPAEVAGFTTDAPSNPNLLGQAINRYGVIGHSQAAARARRGGQPLILRRDFDTADYGRAGLHFVSLQRSIADFVATRTAMNQTAAQLQNPLITDTVNNGINEFIFVLKRGNYMLPARAQRSFPLLPGRESLLES
jgi:hypothetical protein